MAIISQNRRQFLGTLASTTVIVPAAISGRAGAAEESVAAFRYEIERTESEWRTLLSDHEFDILREFKTEPRFSSRLWNEDRTGEYRCRGCDLPVYSSEWKTLRTIGWVFFFHSIPDSTLTSIDVLPEDRAEMEEAGAMATPETMIETHCRRCGSHHGHIVLVEGDILHCINGASLTFHEAA